jgi:nitroreductase
MRDNNFSRPVTDLIEARSSWRSYDLQPLEEGLRQKIQEYLAEKTRGPFGHKTRFLLIETDKTSLELPVRLGTYGFVKNARSFIAGAVTSGPRHWEDYGYQLEEIILKMTDLGLGTCWLGGTFKRGEFGKILGVLKDEIIPAVTPVGYRTEGRSMRDRVIRWGAKSHSRKPWETFFFDKDFGTPLTVSEAGEYAHVLEMIRLAPSASNKQPWRFVRLGGDLHLYLQRTPNYSGFGHSLDLQRVDIGIAMCHLELSAREAGLAGRWESDPPEISLPKHAEYIVTWHSF